jgi:hypothetical protein
VLAEFYPFDADFIAVYLDGDVAALVNSGKCEMLGGDYDTAVVVDLLDFVFVFHRIFLLKLK